MEAKIWRNSLALSTHQNSDVIMTFDDLSLSYKIKSNPETASQNLKQETDLDFTLTYTLLMSYTSP